MTDELKAGCQGKNALLLNTSLTKARDGLENCCSGSLVWTTTAQMHFYSRSDFQDESNALSADKRVVVRAALSGTKCGFMSISLKILYCLVQMSGLSTVLQTKLKH